MVNLKVSTQISVPQFKAHEKMTKMSETQENRGAANALYWILGLGLTALGAYAVCALSKGKIKAKNLTTQNSTNPINQIDHTPKIKEMTLVAFKRGKDAKIEGVNCLVDGKAILADGSNYSGKIIAENNDGSRVVLDYADGILQKSIKTAEDGTQIFEKTYNNGLIKTVKNGDEIKTVNRARRDSDIFISNQRLEFLLNEKNLTLPDEEFAEKLNGIKYKSKKQVDEILDLRKKTLDDIEYKKYLENEAKELKEAEKKLWESESRNNDWVEEQKKAKAEDYKNWWNDALIERDKPLIEANIKAIKQLEKEYQEGLASFIEKHKNDPFPSVEERVKLYADCARTRYGSSYVSALDDLKWEIKEQTFEGYLKSLYDRTPEAREIFYKVAIKKMNPEQLWMYNKASEVLNSRGAEFDKCELARHIAFDRKGKLIHGILNNKFDNHGEILTHLHAFKFNGALRAGHQVDDIERVILDEGFKTVKPLDEERILYRHVCGGKRDKSIDFINMLMKSKPGDTFVDKGYSYTSIYEGAAVSCNGIKDKGTPGIKMTIKAPKGARISDGTDFEQREFLFPRNAEFRVIEPPKLKDDYGLGGYYEMLVEYVLPSANKC